MKMIGGRRAKQQAIAGLFLCLCSVSYNAPLWVIPFWAPHMKYMTAVLCLGRCIRAFYQGLFQSAGAGQK